MTDRNGLSFPLGIGPLSAIAGCSPETIRYYEKQDMLPQAARTPGGHRQYGRSQLRLLQFILRARQLGFSQPDVRQLLQMADPVNTDCEQVHDLATRQLTDVKKRLRDLRKLENTLKGLIASCVSEGGATECPMIDSLLEK